MHKDQNLIPPQFKQKEIKKSEENHEILKVGVFMGAAISAFIVYRMFWFNKIIKSAIFLLKSFNHEHRNTKNKEPSIFTEEAHD